jgi:putative nucleotidyltransferase with HDIG domain
MSGRILSQDELKKAIKMDISRRIREGQIEIPLLPHIAGQAMQIANDPTSSIPQIVGLVEQDQFIAAKIINVANSPVYKTMYAVTSVQRAVMNIGLRGVTDLIFSLSIGGKIFRSKHFSERMNQLWQHSIGCAFIAQEIARSHHRDAENAFLCGLLHDIGKALIVDVISNQIKRSPDRFALGTMDIEFLDDILDEFHAQVGGLIGRKWNFPESLMSAIVFHHNPIGEKGPIKCALHTGVANLLCHRLGLGVQEDSRDISTHSWVKALGITLDQYKTMEKNLHGQAVLFISSFL